MRVFVTGATGFAGSHLVEQLLAQDHRVYALTHPASSHQRLPQDRRITGIEGDLLDQASIEHAVNRSRPDVIYHLAGQAYPERSWENPSLTMAVNAGGTANVLQAAVRFGRPRVVVVTSAELYGNVDASELPITEASVPRPRHPYGVSKWAAGKLTRLFWQRYDLPVIEARPFNHVGPRQALGFVVTDFASQLAAIKLEQQSATMMVGNLSAQRDFTDVRDVVRAYVDLADSGKPGEAYLICSGQPVSIHYLLDVLIELSGMVVNVAYNPDRMRPSDTPCLYGSYGKIESHTGWRPGIHLRESLADALQDWVDRLSAK